MNTYKVPPTGPHRCRRSGTITILESIPHGHTSARCRLPPSRPPTGRLCLPPLDQRHLLPDHLSRHHCCWWYLYRYQPGIHSVRIGTPHQDCKSEISDQRARDTAKLTSCRKAMRYTRGELMDIPPTKGTDMSRWHQKLARLVKLRRKGLGPV